MSESGRRFRPVFLVLLALAASCTGADAPGEDADVTSPLTGPTPSPSPPTVPAKREPASPLEPGPARLVAWTAEVDRGNWLDVRGRRLYTQTGGMDGELIVYRTDCRADGGECSPLWRGEPGNVHVVGDVVLVDAVDEKLYAYRRDCRTDGGHCEPLWTGRGSQRTPVDVHGDVAYVHGSGAIHAYPLDCRTDGQRCRPDWIGVDGYFEIAGDILYALARNGRIYGYPLECGRPCQPYFRTIPLVVGRGPDAEIDRRFEVREFGILDSKDSAIVAMVTEASSDYASITGRLFALPTRCRTDGGTCWPLWRTRPFLSPASAVHDGRVYVVSETETTFAYPVSCGAGYVWCAPVWSGAGPDIPGAVSLHRPRFHGDSVYVTYAHDNSGANGGSATILVFPESCVGECEPTWALRPDATFFRSWLLGGRSLFVSLALYPTEIHATRVFATGCIEGGGACPALWRHRESVEFRRPPSLDRRVVVLEEGGGELTARLAPCPGGIDGCQPFWTLKDTKGYQGYPRFGRDGTAYVAGGWAVQAAPARCDEAGGCTGLWEWRSPQRIAAGPVVRGDLVFLRLAEAVVALDPPGGSPR